MPHLVQSDYTTPPDRPKPHPPGAPRGRGSRAAPLGIPLGGDASHVQLSRKGVSQSMGLSESDVNIHVTRKPLSHPARLCRCPPSHPPEDTSHRTRPGPRRSDATDPSGVLRIHRRPGQHELARSGLDLGGDGGSTGDSGVHRVQREVVSLEDRQVG